MEIEIDGITIRPEDCRPTAETLARILPHFAETAVAIQCEDHSTFRPLSEFREEVQRLIGEPRS